MEQYDGPIALVVGMPKSGTSSISKYFKCHGKSVGHWHCKHNAKSITGSTKRYCAKCYEEAYQKGLPIFESCGKYDVYAQMDYEYLPGCYFPQIELLNVLVEQAPNATLILNLRPSDHWVKSVQNWGSMSKRLALCNISTFRKQHWENRTAPVPLDYRLFYERHSAKIRAFAAAHPAVRFLEIDIEEPDAGTRMNAYFNFTDPARHHCWGQANHNKRLDPAKPQKKANPHRKM